MSKTRTYLDDYIATLHNELLWANELERKSGELNLGHVEAFLEDVGAIASHMQDDANESEGDLAP